MRGPSLLLVTLLATVTLSGCIQGLLPQDAAPPPATPTGPEWVELPLPAALHLSGLLGVWVSEGATGLRMATMDVDAAPRYFDPDAFEATSSRVDTMPPLLLVHGPDGNLLAAGTGDDDLGPRHEETTAMKADPTLFLDIVDPAPGLHVIALYGSHAPPKVSVQVPPAADVYPVLPIGSGWSREMLASSWDDDVGLLERQGDLRPPTHTVRADADISGYGVQGQVALVNATGGLVAAHAATIASVPGEQELVPLIFWPAFQGHESRPVAASADTWRWDARLAGPGYAFAWTEQSLDLAPPAPLARDRPLADQLIADSARDVIPLAGTIAPGSGAWFTLDEPARIRPVFASHGASYENGQLFRIYDETGKRVAWDLVPDDARAYPLPAGRLLVVNDGFRDLTLEILDGAAPADAALHEATTETVTLNLATFLAGGYWEESASVYLPGPASMITLQRYDDLFTEFSLTLTDLDGRVAANAPQVGFDGPVFPYYCCVGGPGRYETSTPFVDGGRYRVTASAVDVESLGGLDVEIVTFVLDGGVTPQGEQNPVPGR